MNHMLLQMPCTMVPVAVAVLGQQNTEEQWSPEEEEEGQLVATRAMVRARAVTCPTVRDSAMVILLHLEPVWELVWVPGLVWVLVLVWALVVVEWVVV